MAARRYGSSKKYTANELRSLAAREWSKLSDNQRYALRSHRAHLGHKTRELKARLDSDDIGVRNKAREQVLRDVERLPTVKHEPPGVRQIRETQYHFYRRLAKLGYIADQIWALFYGKARVTR